MKKNTSSLRFNQKGLVSIIVTMVLIILMTLVVLAMSQNSNREQRQALDRQLSDQAFYNAETGINDWANYLRDNSGADVERKDCNVMPPIGAPLPDIGTDGVNKYSCLLYDKAPFSIEFEKLSISDSEVVPIEPFGSGLSELKFTWRAVGDDSSVTGCALSATSKLPQRLPDDCNVGGIRISLINPEAGSRDDIRDFTYVGYLLPGSDIPTNGNIIYNSSPAENPNLIGAARCSSEQCVLTIKAIPLGAGESLMLHMQGLYNSSRVTIEGCVVPATPVTPCQRVRFNDAQLMIDSTGKSNDVLRRVQVRIPARNDYEYPGSFSLKTTESICKLIEVSKPTNTAIPGTATQSTQCPTD